MYLMCLQSQIHIPYYPAYQCSLPRKAPDEFPDIPEDPKPTPGPDEVPEIPGDTTPNSQPDEITPPIEPPTMME